MLIWNKHVLWFFPCNLHGSNTRNSVTLSPCSRCYLLEIATVTYVVHAIKTSHIIYQPIYVVRSRLDWSGDRKSVGVFSGYLSRVKMSIFQWRSEKLAITFSAMQLSWIQYCCLAPIPIGKSGEGVIALIIVFHIVIP